MKISCHFFSPHFFFVAGSIKVMCHQGHFYFMSLQEKLRAASRSKKKNKKGGSGCSFFFSPGARERVRDTMRKLPNVAELLV